jgi:hypothetical protein
MEYFQQPKKAVGKWHKAWQKNQLFLSIAQSSDGDEVRGCFS